MVALGHRVHGHRVLQGASVASPPVHGCIAYSFSKAWPTGLVAGQLDTRRAFGYQQAPHPAFAAARRPTTAAAATQPDKWYERNENSSKTTSNSNSGAISADKKQRSRHYYDSTPKRRQRAQQQQHDQDRAVQQQQQQYSSNRDVDEAAGWWETPREARHAQQAPAASLAVDAQLDLLPWQEERLLLSAAGSKKKTQVQELAQDLGLDRSEVLAWLAAFRAKPKQQQEQLLAPLQHKVQQKPQQQQQAAANKPQQQQANASKLPQPQQQQDIIDSSWDADPAAVSSPSSRGSPLPFSSSNPDTGFIPYVERRSAAAAGASSSHSGRRLSGEVLRTLEGVYNRSPWPSRDVVQGVFELHKLHRDVVLEWFSARRQMDGLPDNPRTAKRTGITPPSAAAQQQQQQQALIPKPTAAATNRDTSKQQQQQLQAGKAAEASPAAAAPVSRLTVRELTALRSRLPSPKKFKGEKLQKELGIRAGADSVPQQIEISGVVFVACDGAAAWRIVWRRRRAKIGLPAQKLDFHNLF